MYNCCSSCLICLNLSADFNIVSFHRLKHETSVPHLPEPAMCEFNYPSYLDSRQTDICTHNLLLDATPSVSSSYLCPVLVTGYIIKTYKTGV